MHERFGLSDMAFLQGKDGPKLSHLVRTILKSTHSYFLQIIRSYTFDKIVYKNIYYITQYH